MFPGSTWERVDAEYVLVFQPVLLPFDCAQDMLCSTKEGARKVSAARGFARVTYPVLAKSLADWSYGSVPMTNIARTLCYIEAAQEPTRLMNRSEDISAKFLRDIIESSQGTHRFCRGPFRGKDEYPGR